MSHLSSLYLIIIIIIIAKQTRAYLFPLSPIAAGCHHPALFCSSKHTYFLAYSRCMANTRGRQDVVVLLYVHQQRTPPKNKGCCSVCVASLLSHLMTIYSVIQTWEICANRAIKPPCCPLKGDSLLSLPNNRNKRGSTPAKEKEKKV